MAKWRQVDTRLWTDRKFMSASDDGRMVWLWLLTSPFTMPIPGVIVAGEMAIAESIGWSVERYRIGYRELLTKGFSVRFDGRLIWLSKALNYQKIAGPKHISAMSKCWDDVPDCDTKADVFDALKIACKSWSKLFEKGFAIPLRKGIGYPNVQETETETYTETEKDQKGAASPAPTREHADDLRLKVDAAGGDTGKKRNALSESEHHRAIAHFTARYESAYHTKPSWNGPPSKLIGDLVKTHGSVEVMRRTDMLFDGKGPTWLKPPFTVGALSAQWNALVKAGVPQQPNHGRVEPLAPEDYGPAGDQKL